MASTADKLAANINFGVLGKATELKKRLWFVIGALLVYRLGTYIPLPGIDSRALAEMFRQQGGGLLDMFNMFSGGSLQRMTIFALSIMPYITVSIVVQLMTITTPSLAALRKEGEAGRRKLQQITRYGTVLMASAQAYGISSFLESMSNVVLDPGMMFRLTTMVTLVGGTMFLMWLGEQITQRGIGNGISLIIFTGIVAGLPHALATTLELGRTGEMAAPLILGFLALAVILITTIVFFERAQRRILVQYPKRQMGNKLISGENSHLPLKLNTAGVLPPIFASSLLLAPATLAGFMSQNSANGGAEGADSSGWADFVTLHLSHGRPMYIVLFVLCVFFFCFFYAKHGPQFNPKETAENLKKNGGFIPGIRPGKSTAKYLDYVLTRLTLVGAIYLSVICTIPELLIAKYSVPFYLGGTSLLIVVNVTMDTVAQIHSHLIAHQYEGLIRKAKLKGRR